MHIFFELSTTVVCLLSLALDVYSHEVSGTSVNLMRRPNQRRSTPESLKRHKLALEAKYGFGHAKKQRRASGMNLLTNQDGDSSFFGSLAVGTPPALFDIVLDTGSSDLWLVSQSSTAGTVANIPSGVATFNPSKSSTFHALNQTFAIQYGSGDAQGTLGQDTVQMAGFTMPSQTFAVVDDVSGQVVDAPVSGLMGLAWQQIATSEATPFWEALAQSNTSLTEALFAFQLTRYDNDTSVQTLEPGGTFTLGATNSSLFTGVIEYQDIPDGMIGYWLQQLSAVTVQGHSITLPPGSGSDAAIDTGSTLVSGPADVIAEIYAQIPGSQPGTGEYSTFYMYPCSTDVNVAFTFGNSSVAWPVSATDFAYSPANEPNMCFGAFMVGDTAGTSAPAWVLGDTFLKNVYSVFRYNPPSVGFAKLSDTALDMNGKKAAAPSPTIGSASGTAGTSSTTSTSTHTSSAGRTWHGADAILLCIMTATILGMLMH